MKIIKKKLTGQLEINWVHFCNVFFFTCFVVKKIKSEN
jgi:hypothetical protein